LNSTGRYGHAEVGLNICLGDRDESLRQAYELLASHRRSIVKGINFVKDEGIQELGSLQYFNAGSNIRDTVVGVIVGILLHSRQANPQIPLIGFADKKNGEVKASARTTTHLVNRGIDLCKAIQQVVEKVGGVGGGHDIAAGAVIPQERTEDFLHLLNTEFQKQLN
jgi:RecJ-like exonuclease